MVQATVGISCITLPYEIIEHIAEFLADHIQSVSNLESLSANLNSQPQFRDFLNNIWWQLLSKEMGFNSYYSKELEEMRREMIKKNCMKRSILLARHVRKLRFPELADLTITAVVF